jgi:hypothetical protein
MTPEHIRHAKVQVYADRAGRWRFNIALMLEGGIFDIVAQSSDSYQSEEDAEHMARVLLVHGWQIVDSDNTDPIAMPSQGRLYQLIAGLLLALIFGGIMLASILTFSGCATMPRINHQGELVGEAGELLQEYVPLWNVESRAAAIVAAKHVEIPQAEPAGSGWTEDAGKAGGLLLVAAGIVFSIARDPIKGLLAAAGGGVLYLSTVFLSEIASAMGAWVRDVVPWIMTAGLIAAVGAVVYAGWHYRAVVTGLVCGFEVQKDLTWSERTEAKVKEAQGPVQGWISTARKQILRRLPNE